MKKPHKILLFLTIGFTFFLLLWHLNGAPGFTPLMAMRMTERSFLLEDNELLVQNPTYYYGPEPRYDFVTTDGEYLYYGQARGDTILYWNDFGRWNISDFHHNPKGEHISYISGRAATIYYHDSAADLRNDCIGVPFYIFVDGIDFDEMHGLLEIECTDLLDELPGKHIFRFSATAETTGSGHVLWFGQHQFTVKDRPGFAPYGLEESSIDHLWTFADLTYDPAVLTIVLSNEGEQVYTETITLTGNYDHDWR